MADNDNSEKKPMDFFDDREYIKVPEAQHDETLRADIKAAGAKWDGGRQCWYYNPKLAENPEMLGQFEHVDRNTMKRKVNAYIDVSSKVKDPDYPELKEQIKASGGRWDFDNKCFRVPEIDGKLPDCVKNLPRKRANELVKRVYIDVPREERENKENTKDLSWDRDRKSYFALRPISEDIPEEINGYKTHHPSFSKTLYFKFDNARTDEEFRNKIKMAGCKWSPAYKAWSFTESKENPMPEFLKQFTPEDRKDLKKHTCHQFYIPETNPELPNSKQLREEIYAAGGRWNKNEQTWDIWIEEGQELPKIFNQYQERGKKINQPEQEQSQGRSR